MGLRIHSQLYRIAALSKCVGHFAITLLNVWRLVFLFPSDTLSLKAIIQYFQFYLIKRYQFVNGHFEKPSRLSFNYYVAHRILHLVQRRPGNEAESLIVVHYATKPKNPV